MVSVGMVWRYNMISVSIFWSYNIDICRRGIKI